MIRSKALVTLVTALAAFGCAAIVKNERRAGTRSGRPGAAGLDACLAAIGTRPAIKPPCAGLG